jgi:hypothetical protein
MEISSPIVLNRLLKLVFSRIDCVILIYPLPCSWLQYTDAAEGIRGKEGCPQVGFQIEKGNTRHLRNGKRDSGKKRDSVIHVMVKTGLYSP